MLSLTSVVLNSDITKKLNHKEDLRRQAQQRASLMLIQKSSVTCPICTIPIEKNGGCNKMSCSNCHSYFCYGCMKQIYGYEHFSETTCQLWSEEILTNWARQMQAVEVRARPRNYNENQKKVTKYKTCPTCKVQCVKTDNNNHVLCWSCFHHMCFNCGKAVRNSANHFKASGCPQHTRETVEQNVEQVPAGVHGWGGDWEDD